MLHKRLFSLGMIFALIVAALPLEAKETIFAGEQYSLMVEYNDEACPGDAVFVRFIAQRTKRHNQQAQGGATRAALSLGGKSVDFFEVPPRSGRKAGPDAYVELLASMPLSTWREAGVAEFSVLYSAFGSEDMTFTLPVTVKKKDFDSETIPLNETNTAIRTDTSPARLSQIDTLNAILETRDAGAVYHQGAFVPPTTAARRTSGFGDRRVYVYSSGRKATSEHYGIDYGVPTGTPVTACGAGKVVLAENRISTGWSVVIEHLPGLYSLYYHMDSLEVKVNQMVKAGDEIGKSGATGLATGPHLHWEIRLNTVAVNPDFFTADFSFFDEKR